MEKIEDVKAVSAKIGEFAKIGPDATIGGNATIGRWVTIGQRSKIEDGAMIGDGVTIGDNATIGRCATIGNGVAIGRSLTLCGLKTRAWMCLSNVDGSGRQVKVIVHTGGIAIETGCFFGTLEAFCAKADGDGKHRYSVVVRAAAEALLADANDHCDTGGW